MSDVAVLGGPSLLRAWAEELLREAATIAGTPEAMVLDFLGAPPADIGEQFRTRPYLIVVKEPPTWLLGMLAAERMRAVVILEDPVDAVAYSRALKGCSLLEGVRDQSAATTTALALRASSSAKLISRNIPIDARELASELLQYVGWSISAADRERLLHAFGGPLVQPWPIEQALAGRIANYAPQLRESVELLIDEEVSAVTGALDPPIMLTVGMDARPILWPRALLLDGDDFVRPAQSSIDLTGPARNLVRGPYLCLPPGRYSCHYVMDFEKGAEQTRFALEVHGKHLLAEHCFIPPTPGTMALDFELEIDGPDHWIDLRFRLAEGTIEGRASVVRVEWRLMGATDGKLLK